MNRICLRIAAATAAAALSLFPISLLVQEGALAVGRPGSPSGPKINLNEMTTTQRAVPPTSVKKSRRPGSSTWWAKWDGTLSRIQFAISGTSVRIWDIHRDELHQPKGVGGQMIADSLRKANFSHPSEISITAITNPPTINGLADGMHPSETVLGRTIAKAVSELEGAIANWDSGLAIEGNSQTGWITVTITYPVLQ